MAGGSLQSMDGGSIPTRPHPACRPHDSSALTLLNGDLLPSNTASSAPSCQPCPELTPLQVAGTSQSRGAGGTCVGSTAFSTLSSSLGVTPSRRAHAPSGGNQGPEGKVLVPKLLSLRAWGSAPSQPCSPSFPPLTLHFQPSLSTEALPFLSFWKAAHRLFT